MTNPKEVWLYFNTEADNDNIGVSSNVCFRAQDIVSMGPTGDSELTIFYKSIRNQNTASVDEILMDKVAITLTTANTHFALATGLTTPLGLASKLDNGISACGAIVVAAANAAVTNYKFPDIGTGGVAPTVLSGAGALTVNKHHTCSITAARAYTIPSAAAGSKGDWMTVLYLAEIADSTVHTYTVTTDSNFALGSHIRVEGEDGTRVPFIDTSVANDDEVQITGATNGDGGIGTTLRFVNTTGTTDGWAVDAVIKGQDAMSIASAATVFTS